MKTTLDIDDRLLRQAKALAARERKSLARLIEEGLSLRLRPPPARGVKPTIHLPVFRGGSGMAPGIDPLSNKSIYDALYEAEKK
ncbi:MAG: DUF6364 family protein [Gammaproteobacteria bacterium]